MKLMREKEKIVSINFLMRKLLVRHFSRSYFKLAEREREREMRIA